jgi:starch synthase (maltosyl-transferring)
MGTARRQFTDEIKREALGLLVSSGRPLRRILRGWPEPRILYGKVMRHALMCAQKFMNRALVCAQGERDVRPTKDARPPDCRGRVIIESVYPELDGGRHPVKRVIGDVVEVSADIFTDGHDKIAGDILFRVASEDEWQRSPLRFLENDRWSGSFTAARLGLYYFTIEAWRDPFASLIDAIEKKRAAGSNLRVDAKEAKAMIADAKPRVEDAATLRLLLEQLSAAPDGGAAQIELILAPQTKNLMARIGPRPDISHYDCELAVRADPERALFSSWYELFPRSVSDSPHRYGTLRDVIAYLPYIRNLGFDVVYFPPIHPIGKTNRKGRNNALTASESDPGSVYAIGAREGGHAAIHPELGSLDDFRALVAAAREQGLEIALDFAIQCSPDHPWIKEHPEWFAWRPDGTIEFAQNPPKTYEDIVNMQFYGGAFPAVWRALHGIVCFWIGEGVRIFRVDNPHTKPLPFWRWLIDEINRACPDVIFLAEAFTRPKMMKKLAKIGFHQSYTYFTWRNEKWEITEYMRELTGEMSEYFRPNFFVNTPDINPFYLQTGGPAAFIVRSTLAATLSSNWGMYSGFEFCEAEARQGKEEYLNSEKYEIKVRDPGKPGNIKLHIAALNQIRRSNPALHDFHHFLSLNAWNDMIIAYARMTADKTNCVMVLVNLDPHHRQECAYEVPLWEFGLPDHASIEAEDLLRGGSFTLYGKNHQIALDPNEQQVVIWRLTPPANWSGAP